MANFQLQLIIKIFEKYHQNSTHHDYRASIIISHDPTSLTKRLDLYGKENKNQRCVI